MEINNLSGEPFFFGIFFYFHLSGTFSEHSEMWMQWLKTHNVAHDYKEMQWNKKLRGIQKYVYTSN